MCNSACRCILPVCGNGVIELGEQCDGNTSACDGCSQYCCLELRGQRFQSCVVNYNYTGGVKRWGYNGGYYLGDGTANNSNVPVDVTDLTAGVAAIYTGGGALTCALMDTGGVKCWGANGSGSLGTAETTAYTTDQDVKSSPPESSVWESATTPPARF